MVLAKVRDWVLIVGVIIALTVGGAIAVMRLTASHPSAVQQACSRKATEIAKITQDRSANSTGFRLDRQLYMKGCIANGGQ